MNNKISVLIYASSNKISLKACLESVLNQKLKADEIIILDSIDRDNFNFNLIKPYLDSNQNIKYIKKQNNSNFIQDYKKLFELATGDYIKFLPYYALLEENALEKLASFLDKNEDIKLAMSNIESFYDYTGKKIIAYTKYFKQVFTETTILESNEAINKILLNFTSFLGYLSSSMFRKKDIDFKLFEYEEMNHITSADILLSVQLLKKGSLAFIEEKLVSQDFNHFFNEYEVGNLNHLEREISSFLFTDLCKTNISLFDKFSIVNTLFKDCEILENHALIRNIDKLYKSMKSEEIKKDKSISIVIVTYNSISTIEDCIKSSLENIYENDEIIIVDNNSKDKTPEYLKTLKHKQIKVVFSNENLGFSGGVNLGIKNTSNKDVVMLLNPDAILSKNSVSKLVNHLYDSEEIGLVGPISDGTVFNQNILCYLAKFLSNLRLNLEKMANICYHALKGQTVDSKLIIGFCMAIKKELLDKYGYLDQTLFVGADDLEICWRLAEKGYKFKTCIDTFVHHKGQVSFKTTSPERINHLNKQSSDALAEILIKNYGFGNVPTSEELWNMNWFGPTYDNYSKMYKKFNLFEDSFLETSKSMEIFKETGYLDINDSFAGGFFNCFNIPFNNIFDKEEIEKKLFILSAYENITYNDNFSRFDFINMYIKSQAYKYGIIKGIAEGLNKFFNYKINTNLKILKTPLISVIIIIQDNEYFYYSIESILKQSYSNIEIIALINIKDDKINEKINNLENLYNKKIIREDFFSDNYSESIKKALTYSKGDYIKILSENEYFLPTSIEILVRALNYSNFSSPIVFDNYSDYFKDTQKIKNFEISFVNKNTLKSQWNDDHFCFERSSLIKKDLLLNIDSSLDIMSIFDTFNNLLLDHTFYKINLTSLSFKIDLENNILLGKDKNLSDEKVYKDNSCLKTLDKINFSEILYDEINSKKIKDFISSSIAKNKNILIEFLLSILSELRKNNLISESDSNIFKNDIVATNNKSFNETTNFYTNTIEELKYTENDLLIENFINYNDKINKLAFYGANSEIFFDNYLNKNYAIHYKENNDSDGHIIISSDFPYAIFPEKWIDIFNTKADQIWVPNNFIKEVYSTVGVVSEKIKVLNYAPNIDMYYKTERKNKFNKNETFNFLAITKFNDLSGINELLEGYKKEFSEKDNVCLILIPDKTYSYKSKQDVEKLISNDKNSPKVIIYNDVFSNLTINEIYNSADCYIETYKLENRGINIINAMLCELPVIVTGGGVSEDFCDEENAYLVEAELLEKEASFFGVDAVGSGLFFFDIDKNDLQEKMRFAFENKENNNLIGKKAREKIINDFNKEKLISSINFNLTEIKKKPIIRENIDSIKKELYDKASELIKKENFESAKNILSDLCKYEKNSRYYYLLGFCFYKISEFDEAITFLSQSIEIGELNYDICSIMSLCLKEIGADDEADVFRLKAREYR